MRKGPRTLRCVSVLFFSLNGRLLTDLFLSPCLQQADFIYKLWTPRPVITTGGYDRESGLKIAEETGQLIGYARAFSANVCRVSPLPYHAEC